MTGLAIRRIVSVISLLILTAMHLHAQPLPVIRIDPVVGPICAGPRGPGPCAAVEQWIRTHPPQPPGMPVPVPSPRFPSAGAPIALPPPGALFPQSPAWAQASNVSGAIQCAQMTAQNARVDVNVFVGCTRSALVLDRDSMTMVNCAERTQGNLRDFGDCAGSGIIGRQLTADQKRAVRCAAQHSSDGDDFAHCIASGMIGDRLNDQQRQVLDCAANNGVDSARFASCAGQALLGDHLSPTAKAAVECATESQGDATGFAGCAANKFLKANLNPEQQIAMQCVVSTGSQPYAAGSCAAARLTARELTKCATNGFGGEDGCFGDNNDLVGKNGFVVRNVGALAGGPNSFIRDPGQVMGGQESLLNHPGQVLGGPNSVPNQLLKNVPSPPPIEVYRDDLDGMRASIRMDSATALGQDDCRC